MTLNVEQLCRHDGIILANGSDAKHRALNVSAIVCGNNNDKPIMANAINLRMPYWLTTMISA